MSSVSDCTVCEVSDALDARDQMHARRSGLLLLVVASVLWSLTGLMVKLAAMPAVSFVLWRAIGAACATAAMISYRKRPHLPHVGWLLLAMLLNTIVATTVVWTMSNATAAKGIVLQYTGPIFCALLARWTQGRRISSGSKIALTLASVGIGIMVFSGHGRLAMDASAAGILCGFSFGALILVLEMIQTRSMGRANPLIVVLCMNLGTSAVALMLCPASIRGGSVSSVSIAMMTGISLTAVPYSLFQVALRRVRATDASLLVLLEPVLNPIWVAIGVGEVPDRLTLIGGGATLLAAMVEAVNVTFSFTRDTKMCKQNVCPEDAASG